MMSVYPQSELISPPQLAQALEHSPLQVVDCRFQLSDPAWGYEQYLQGHIPGAVYLHLDRDLSSPIGRHGGRHPLPEPSQLVKTLAKMGITLGETWVVAYDDSRFAFASRLWWLLRYLGHERVSLLDGGWQAWQAAGLAIASGLGEVSSIPIVNDFVPTVQSDWLVDWETMQTKLNSPGTVLVDSRERDRYEGKREPIDPIAGHIEGAICLPWQEVTTPDGYCQSPAILRQRWQEQEKAEEIIVYCGSGVTACVNLFSRAIAGLPMAKLYPGGWSDWCSYLIKS
jgi:thiosulfate/3-mercaptopyruvate sulfurtransferase